MPKLKVIFLAVILFLLPTYLVRFSIGGIPTTLLEILIYLGLIWSLGNLKDWRKLKKIPPIVQLSIALFMISAVIGVLVSPDKTAALGQLKGFIVDPLLLAALIYIWVPKEKLNWLIGGLILSGVALSSLSIYQTLAGITTFDGRALSVWQYDPGASPNYLSLYLTPIAILAFTQLFQKTAPPKKLKISTIMQYGIMVLAWGIILAGLYFSGSRGGLLAASAGIIYFLFKTFRQAAGARWGGWLIIILAIATIYLTGKPNFSATPDSGRISSSNNIRWQIWQITIKEIIPGHWLAGIGLGNFQNYFTQLTAGRVNFPEYIAPRALTPHNLFLTLWANGGIIMLGSFLILLYLIYTIPSPNVVIEKSVLFGIITYGLVDTPFLKNDLSILVWLIFVIYLIKNQKTA